MRTFLVSRRGVAIVVIVGAVVAVAALFWIVYELSFGGGVGAADAVGGVVGALAAVVSGAATLLLLWFPPERSAAEVLDHFREELRGQWNAALHERHLEEDPLLPITVIKGRGRAVPHTDLRRAADQQVTWRGAQYQKYAADTVKKIRLARAFVYGESGAGKSTFARMATLGLLADKGAQRPVPILMSLESWDGSDKIDHWLDRRLAQTYPSLRPLASRGSSIWRKLVYGTSVMFLFDGLDQVSRDRRAEVIAQIHDLIPKNHKVVVFTRYVGHQHYEKEFGRAETCHLVRPSARSVAAFLEARAKKSNIAPAWAPVVKKLRDEPHGRLAEALRSPWHVSLAWQAYEDGPRRPEELCKSAEEQTDCVVAMLLDCFLERKLGSSDLRCFGKASWYLEYVAHNMQKGCFRSFGWWLLYKALPVRVLAVSVGLAVAPAYWLALELPPGLTRGFAVGTTAGVALGLLRGIRPSGKNALATTGSAAVTVALVGLFVVRVDTVLVDVAQISVALGLVVGLRSRLVQGWWPVLVVPLIGGVSALAVELVHRLFTTDTDRSAQSVLLSTTLGLGVAVLAVRLLSDPAKPPQPSHAVLAVRSKWRQLPASLLMGVLVSILVGVAGGVSGAVTYGGLSYGVALAVIFGIVLGVPIGLVVGIIRWLESPVGLARTVTPLSALRNDRMMSVGSMVAVSLVSTLSIVVLSSPLGSFDPVIASALHIEWYHGLMFGLGPGLVFACIRTAWPAFFVYHVWVWSKGRFPWRLGLFFTKLHEQGIVRREGSLYQFHHESLQDRLDARYHQRLGTPLCARADGSIDQDAGVPQESGSRRVAQ